MWFARTLLLSVASLGVLLGLVAWLVHAQSDLPTMATAKVLVETLTLELAETEGEVFKPAAQPQVDASTPPPPQPMTDLPTLSDAQSDFILPAPPPLEVPKLPDLPAFEPTLLAPQLKATALRLPEITLAPLQPLPLPTDQPNATPPTTAQISQGATAQVKQKTRLKTDLSMLMKRYPPEALKRRWEGTVTLRLTIGEGGELRDVSVEQSSGYRVLDREAIRMMRKAQFEGGPDVILQKVEFNLKKTGHVDD
jgi:protein TonB